MTVEIFFDHFLEELETTPELHYYYKYHQDANKLLFRKAYFCQRLQYIYDQVINNPGKIWDCGCGFGTTGIFLSLNGIPTHGTTLEHYIQYIPKRLDYYSQFGNTELFSYSYADLFENQKNETQYDTIIIQDTLHHLEPMDEALTILNNSLRKGGKMIVVEENGANLIQSAKLYKQRGNKRVIEIFDETLQKNILLGNENIRSLEQWQMLMQRYGFSIPSEQVNYVRYFLLKKFTPENYAELIKQEQKIWKKSKWRRNYFFFGLNFIAVKN